MEMVGDYIFIFIFLDSVPQNETPFKNTSARVPKSPRTEQTKREGHLFLIKDPVTGLAKTW